ncbi:MAG: hypothetical protein HC836_43030 [Richelia sp. RM2_1_2]|nr:hypothetical protein [Richelia sp. RM2_1_2]
MIGKLATDGVAIMSPEDDVIDTFQDYDHSSMRFFWLVESKCVQPVTSELRNKFLLEGRTLAVDEEVLRGITNKDKNIGSWIWCGDNINLPGSF